MIFTRGIYIDGDYFDIPIVSIKRNADFLDKFAERVETGEIQRELIGVYFNYTMSVGKSSSFPDGVYKRFWNKVTEPVPFHIVLLPTDSGYYEYTAYISSVSDEYEKITQDSADYKGFTCKFTAKEPARRP